MAEGVTPLAAFVNGSRCGWCNMARNPTWKRELLEQPFHALFVLRYVGINLAPGAFEVNVAHNCRSTVTRSGHIKHIQIILFDDPVQMHIDEILAGRRA